MTYLAPWRILSTPTMVVGHAMLHVRWTWNLPQWSLEARAALETILSVSLFRPKTGQYSPTSATTIFVSKLFMVFIVCHGCFLVFHCFSWFPIQNKITNRHLDTHVESGTWKPRNSQRSARANHRYWLGWSPVSSSGVPFGDERDSGYPCLSMDILGHQLKSIDIKLTCMNIYGYPWIFMDVHAYPWKSIDIHRIHEHPWCIGQHGGGGGAKPWARVAGGQARKQVLGSKLCQVRWGPRKPCPEPSSPHPTPPHPIPWYLDDTLLLNARCLLLEACLMVHGS